MELDSRILMFVIFGLGLTLAVTLERVLARFWLSLPILYVGVGFLLFSLPLGLPHINPTLDGFDAVALEYLTEFIVIASLMAAGGLPARRLQPAQPAPARSSRRPIAIGARRRRSMCACGRRASTLVVYG